MSNLEEETRSLTEELHTLEYVAGRHIRASIKPQINNVSKQEKYLDTFARLLTGTNDVCVAVCYCEKEDSLFVASNKERPEYAEQFYLPVLQKFADVPSPEKYRELVGLSIVNQVFPTIKKRSAEEPTLISEEDSWKEFKKKVAKYYGISNEINKLKKKGGSEGISKLEKSLAGLVDEILILKEELLEEVKLREKEGKLEEANFKWDYLTPLEDVDAFTKAIREGGLDSKIIKVIRNIKIDNEESIRYIEGTEKVHAEMKIVNKFCQDKEGQISSYIGINKLTCVACWCAINIFRETSDYQLSVRGTHGGTYSWTVPLSFSQVRKEKLINELKRIKNNQFLKLRETTSEIPVQKLEVAKEQEKQRNELVELVTMAKDKLNEISQELLEMLLESQVELMRNNSYFLRKQAEKLKKILGKDLSKEEIDLLVNKQNEVANLEQQLTSSQQIEEELKAQVISQPPGMPGLSVTKLE